jgi:prevent-host-death family protein
MSISIAQSRQQLSFLIQAAQSTPQVITKRNTPVAVLVSADYFKRTESVALGADDFYSKLMSLRQAYPPLDNVGIPGAAEASAGVRAAAWARSNSFADGE